MTSKRPAEEKCPLSEAWWDEERRQPSVPPDDVPILGPYEKVQPGFEALAWPALEYYRALGDGHVELCLWDIWPKGEDDPASKDEDKLKINEMQRVLGKPSDDDRFIRI